MLNARNLSPSHSSKPEQARMPAWPPAHQPIPSAAPLLRRLRRDECWGRVAPLTR